MPSRTDLEAIDRLEKLSYSQKVALWGKKYPWEGLKLPNQTKVTRSSVTVRDGNVVRMPPLAGKPCFGIPTAWLRHGKAVGTMTGKLYQPARCTKCLANEGCEKVAEARLGIDDEIREAVASFRMHGGVKAMDEGGTANRAQEKFWKLDRLLRDRGPYDSINDVFATSYLETEIDRKKKKAVDDKRKQRNRAMIENLKSQIIDEKLRIHLLHHQIYRVTRYQNFCDTGIAPRSVTTNAIENGRFTADVWLSRVLLQITRQSCTAYSIARHMIHVGDDRGLAHASLRDRITQALVRISLLEKTKMPGSDQLVWEKFSLAQALRDLSLTPYEDPSSDA